MTSLTPRTAAGLAGLLLMIFGLSCLHAQEADKRFERMWLPASAQHLRPFLLMAMERALEDQTCTEVLYARLNEYRTIYEEPTFTILCKKDYKTTFNKVFQITEIDPEYNSRIAESQAAAANANNLSGAIEALRQQLIAPSEVVTPAPLPTPAPTAAPAAIPHLQEDPNDLSLDLRIGTPSNP
ncbi:MAG: hypothetical protein Q8L60_17165 [Gammaproteobacteria bacterium]|nr:hypothetical protein [Gammaproteobacteria bacterium]MDP2140658.1 hypothetical protein [Gammaproteobacteria bacterium]MDP2347430.1 hypothetical protein [Gammaproteobacteria bacterium]